MKQAKARPTGREICMTKSIRGLLQPKDVHIDVSGSCKRYVLEVLANEAATSFGLDASTVHEKLMQRERLGSTGVGGGIAIPHARVGVPQMAGLVLTLREPVDFESMDGAPVDIVFLLLAPADDNASHLKALSRVARTFRIPGVADAVRQASDVEMAYAALLSDTDQAAA